ncbi:hypothetical protein SCMU_38830 [Sinomonas cyclohexanicum]|uniref:PucR family transcriptional regulator n=1 Tax=Sinomonas cyclohexanicum TaxID=322009 RepID=A0ABM7Q0E9_SINCY|nr:PucR family transcriptional regulator [Corynebacterium cyclohexanicum]BCT78041.1 hypothetical protein SCMU_38830 [Corynebacterium cyclohexanicum]
MAMTVSELLSEPQLGLGLVAGAAGVGNRITWAHTSDLPRLWEWVTGGELMMTNGLSIPADPAGQVELAEGLVAAGASALAIGEKMHAPELTAEFLAACDTLPLPVLSVPFPLPFVAISQAVAESSLLEESRRLRQVARIYDLLRHVETAEDPWPRLAGAVERELDADLFVLDADCGDPWHPQGSVLPRDLEAEIRGLVRAYRDSTRTYQWRKAADRDVLMMGIPTHKDAMLVVLPRSEPHPDTVVLLHAASVLGLELARALLGVEERRRAGAEFLLQAFEGRFGASEVEERLAHFGFRAGRLVVVSLESAEPADLAQVHVALWRHGVDAVSAGAGNRLQLAVPEGTAREMLLHAAPPRASMGLSSPRTPSELRRALQESLWALGTAKGSGERLVPYTEGRAWLGLGSLEEGQALVDRILGPLLDHERGREPDLLNTLVAYLECQRSWQKTADTLFVHRQTIIYRMRRVAELTGLDLAETSSVAQLWFALQIRNALEEDGPLRAGA